MTLYVSISRAIIANNAKNGRNDPPYEIREAKDGRPVTAHMGEFFGKVRLVYDTENPLSSKAVCWVEIDPVVEPVRPVHPAPPPGSVIDVDVSEAAEATDGFSE